MNHRITFEDKDIVLLITSFPKGMKALQQFMQDIFNKGTLEGEEPPKVDQHVVNSMLFFSPRVLYDFFDERNIFINMNRINNMWQGMVSGQYSDDLTLQIPSFATRQKAERYAYMEAFKTLENQ